MKKERKIILIILIFIILSAIGGGILLLRISKPGSDDMLSYMEKVYGKDFEILEEFTYISYTDGEPEVRRELKCPAVELQDKENSEIRCIVYAYPKADGAWTYRNNYSKKVLLYCMRQENLMIKNEDECSQITSFAYPCLILENTDETAQKLQNMVIRFNESYQYDDNYHNISGQESFAVEGSIYMQSILAGDVNDRWLEETGPFCYDTSIEKYKTFLEELEQGQAVDKKESENICEPEYMEHQIQMTMGQDVTLNELFALFIAGEIKANSYESAEEKYLSDYYEEYSKTSTNEVYIMLEDLNEDGEAELLINVQKNVNEGKIFIFHSQDGNLFEWKSIPYGMHSPAIYLYYNIVEVAGHGWSRSFFRYNSQGSHERVFDCYSVTDSQENGESWRKYIIVVYQDGIEAEEFSITEIACSDKENDWKVLESSEEVERFDRTLNGFLDKLGKGKQINQIPDDAREILLVDTLKR